ncbi:hypothetical protein GCM10016455_05940 [Aliiroseovarius zhejiangensis]|uniref:Uncharacterized protein n=1 Tax=Aliiroseovarius zhejiangensis TaxID=1632025 RepID=A0ABQ3IMH1_9RHOB|nr:hypothetical protein [Aliiroseovarius zhejiangensis]GHE88616.1 hypothetical protein GCM10016455_05940 [Aliiroseovarius zhejiangensis]
MNEAIKTVVKPGKFNDSLNWIYEEIQARERRKLYPRAISVAAENADPPNSMIDIPKSFTRLRMGHAAFHEAKVDSKANSNTMVDYCDSVGPRLKIFGLVVDPTSDLDPWELELC